MKQWVTLEKLCTPKKQELKIVVVFFNFNVWNTKKVITFDPFVCVCVCVCVIFLETPNSVWYCSSVPYSDHYHYHYYFQNSVNCLGMLLFPALFSSFLLEVQDFSLKIWFPYVLFVYYFIEFQTFYRKQLSESINSILSMRWLTWTKVTHLKPSVSSHRQKMSQMTQV